MEARVSNRLWSLDEPGVRIDRAGDLGDAVSAHPTAIYYSLPEVQR
jgi:hypothetical protein